MGINSITVAFAKEEHVKYAERICTLIYESALQRGTGIAKRTPEYISAKIKGGKAVVALQGDKLVGFSYIECWGHGDYVATKCRNCSIPDNLPRTPHRLSIPRRLQAYNPNAN